MKTFREWLNVRIKERYSGFGDLVKDLKADHEFKGNSVEEITEHIMKSNPSRDCIKVLNKAKEYYLLEKYYLEGK